MNNKRIVGMRLCLVVQMVRSKIPDVYSYTNPERQK